MLHTANILVNPREEHTKYMVDNHGKKTANAILRQCQIDGIEIIQFKATDTQPAKSKIIIDVPKILKTGEISEHDYYRVKAYIKRALGVIYGDDGLYDTHNLIRIDYRYDVKIPSATDRSLYLYLYNKSRKDYRRLKKEGLESFESTIYHKNNSVHTILYSKNEECFAKKRAIEEWEKDVLRFEICLKNAHLYNQTRKTGETKCLQSFFKKSKFDYYIKNYLLNIFPLGDFYNVSKAEELINKSNCSPTIKSRLKIFLRQVTNGTVDTPKITTHSDRISDETWRMRIKKFNELNLNPITIPISQKINYLPNPLNSLVNKKQNVR